MKDFIREKVCFYSSVFPGRLSEYEMLEYAARRGAAGLELFNFSDELRTPDMKEAREIGRRARALGLRLPCFSAGLDFGSGDFDKTLTAAKGYIDICEELEIPFFHHTLAFAMSADKVLPGAAERGLCAALALRDYAKGRGVKTIIEDQGFVYNGVENYRPLLEKSDCEIGVLLDVGNIFFVDETAAEFLDAYKGKIDHVHLKDFALTDKRPESGHYYVSRAGKYIVSAELGTGDVDFPKIAEGLSSSGYTGLYSLELDGVTGEAEIDRVLERTFGWFGK